MCVGGCECVGVCVGGDLAYSQGGLWHRAAEAIGHGGYCIFGAGPSDLPAQAESSLRQPLM